MSCYLRKIFLFLLNIVDLISIIYYTTFYNEIRTVYKYKFSHYIGG
ncbi:hypothetical protein MCSV2_110036 [Mucispirillum schaedleri ASF457]|nr:hypothetical protein MCSV2_110036 [Mucispirillum schaedleri ASF457]